MKTKILKLSDSSLNKIVTHHAELEKAGDNVYTYLFKKDPYREDDDLIAVVLNVEGVYFQEGAYSRRSLRGKDLAHVGSTYVQNFHKTIEGTMQQGRHLPIMFVRIYEELGRDTAPLLKYREDRKERLRQQDEERSRRREQAKKEAEARETQRLQDEKAKFIAGEFISTEDFVALCRQEGIAIPLRTHGTLNRSVTALSHKTGIRSREIIADSTPDYIPGFLIFIKIHDKRNDNRQTYQRNSEMGVDGGGPLFFGGYRCPQTSHRTKERPGRYEMFGDLISVAAVHHCVDSIDRALHSINSDNTP